MGRKKKERNLKTTCMQLAAGGRPSAAHLLATAVGHILQPEGVEAEQAAVAAAVRLVEAAEAVARRPRLPPLLHLLNKFDGVLECGGSKAVV